MLNSVLSSKGQLTLPKEVRDELHVGKGDRVKFLKTSKGKFEIVAASNDVSELCGIIKTDKVVSLEEMEDAIHRRASGKRTGQI